MLYHQIIQNCFVSHVGKPGLSNDDFREFQDLTGPVIDGLKELYESGELPVLRLPEMRSDLEDLEVVAKRFRTKFDDVVVLGTGIGQQRSAVVVSGVNVHQDAQVFRLSLCHRLWVFVVVLAMFNRLHSGLEFQKMFVADVRRVSGSTHQGAAITLHQRERIGINS